MRNKKQTAAAQEKAKKHGASMEYVKQDAAERGTAQRRSATNRD